MAVPRVSLRGVDADISLPQPLSPSDAKLMGRAFAMQDKGDVAAASRLADEVQNPLLLGHLLAARYLGRFHHSTVGELSAWLHHYGDEPDAPAIRALLVERAPKGTVVPPLPAATAPTPAAAPARPPEPTPASDPTKGPAVSRNPSLDKDLAARLARGDSHAALDLIASTKGLQPAYAALLRGEVARWLFSRNEDAAALQTAYLGLKDTSIDQQPGEPAYVGGLAAWRQDRVIEARGMFILAAEAPLAAPRLVAAAAFWAARAAARMHDPAAAREWLHRSAAEPNTLYGFIARRRLGLPTGIIPSVELLSQADIDVVAATGPGLRAFALLQLGQLDRAESELRLLLPVWQHDPEQQHALLIVASAFRMTGLAAQIVEARAAADGQSIEMPHSPMPRLRPDGGFRVDPALIYALTRVESNFDAHAVSHAGARGLMQLMPVTAQYISGSKTFSSKRLHDPSLNLALGQRYISYLARQDAVGDDLLHVLASYNAGPNSFARWFASVHDGGDPLMFIETIPNNETRGFVRRSLTYTWIYAARLHLPAPSLDQLSTDDWPRFTPGSDRGKIIFAAPRVH
jgi:soluble lytic murein transglycosylase-like protein